MGSTEASGSDPLHDENLRGRWTAAVPLLLFVAFLWFCALLLDYGVATALVKGESAADLLGQPTLIEGAIGFTAIASLLSVWIIRRWRKDILPHGLKRR